MPAESYADAVTELYKVPHAEFVNERKRLAGELKAAGDKQGATKLGKLPRPPVSAWAVNQLWWQAREAFEAMLASAEKVRDGDLAATAAHRDTIAKLRVRASSILADAGHGATEGTLRRVTMTLSAIAATGTFDPDPPGALADDRDPPGFETMGIGTSPPPVAPAKPKPAAAAKPSKAETADDDAEPDDEETSKREAAEASRRRDAEEARERAEAAAERRRIEQEEAKRNAERNRVEAALRTAVGEVERRTRDVDRLRGAVADAEEKLEKSRAIVTDLEAKLEGLVSS